MTPPCAAYTAHLELGFSPRVNKDGKKIEVHRFHSMGRAVHPEVLVGFLRDNGVSLQLSDY